MWGHAPNFLGKRLIFWAGGGALHIVWLLYITIHISEKNQGHHAPDLTHAVKHGEFRYGCWLPTTIGTNSLLD